ncbi:MAG TPA: type II toxin-antitoxin system VapC family toxin [Pirellulales bacterium]|nr:type II toxin-antitoxin system VapC family toxin [Pirellulales bacterium]
MNRYLLDTGIMSDFINHRKGVDVEVREARRRGARIGTCMPVVGELFYGVEASATRGANLPRLKRALSGIICWPFDRLAAEEFGRLAAELKRLGRPMQQIDVQIAAIALNLSNCTVVSADSDLAAVPKLMVENWAT